MYCKSRDQSLSINVGGGIGRGEGEKSSPPTILICYEKCHRHVETGMDGHFRLRRAAECSFLPPLMNVIGGG